MMRVAVNPDLLRWARERAGVVAAGELTTRFPKLEEWEGGTARPTLNQLEAFARAAHVPIGYLFLPEPPEEPLPIPDFRTVDGRGVRRPSPSLLDMIYACQERRELVSRVLPRQPDARGGLREQRNSISGQRMSLPTWPPASALTSLLVPPVALGRKR